jgi:hypothetical protein
MKIYLTEEGKKEIEAKIDELNRFIQDPDSIFTYPLLFNECQIMIDVNKQILSSATIAPDPSVPLEDYITNKKTKK